MSDIAQGVIGQNIKNVSDVGSNLAKDAINNSKLNPAAKEMLGELSSKLISGVG